MSKNYRIAIIGVGGIANMHANAVKDLSNATLVGGSCRREEKGKKFAKDFGCNWYAKFEEMLDKEKPDVATIATPSGFHLEPFEACASRGIHVLCEKPLEITTERIDKMIAIAKKSGVTLGGIFPSRFNPLFSEVRKAVGEGRFGKISVGATYVPWWRDDAYYAPERWQGTAALDGGGALMNQSIHGIDALQWIMGADVKGLKPGESPVSEVFAYTGRLGHDESMIEVEDTATAVLKFKNGAIGQILGTTSMWPGSNRRTVISGRDGTAEVVESELVHFDFRDARPEDKALKEKHKAATSTGSTGASNPLAIGHDGHTANLRSFLAAMDEGKSPAIDGVQSRVAVAIIQAIYASAASGKAVAVK